MLKMLADLCDLQCLIDFPIHRRETFDVGRRVLKRRNKFYIIIDDVVQIIYKYSHFLFLGISGSFLRRRSPDIHGSEFVRSNADVDDCEISVCILDGPESVDCGRFILYESREDGPVLKPSPNSSSSVTLLLLLIFANMTLVQTCGSREALTI